MSAANVYEAIEANKDAQVRFSQQVEKSRVRWQRRVINRIARRPTSKKGK